jgi:hypothetical protein
MMVSTRIGRDWGCFGETAISPKQTGGTVCPLVGTVGELGPSVFCAGAGQMMGSKSRMQGKVTMNGSAAT